MKMKEKKTRKNVCSIRIKSHYLVRQTDISTVTFGAQLIFIPSHHCALTLRFVSKETVVVLNKGPPVVIFLTVADETNVPQDDDRTWV